MTHYNFSNISGKLLTEGDFTQVVEKIVSEAKDYVYFASAWVKGGIFRYLVNKIDTSKVDVRLVVRGSEKKDFEITDPGVFGIDGVYYAFHPSLHAKIIIVDGKKAIVGSANITYSGLREGGNREVAILVEDEEAVKELKRYFDTIWNESYIYSPDLVGMIMNPSRSSHLEVLLLKSSYEVPEGSLLIAPWDITEDNQRALILMRVDSVIAYNTGFFLNPFSGDSSNLFPNPAEITFVNDEDKPHAWRVGALMSYVEKSSNFYMARCSVLGIYKDNKLNPLFSAPPIGLPVYKNVKVDSGVKGIESILQNDMAGFPMEMPLKVGNLYATSIPIHIDASYLTKRDKARHMAILGTTGSGKSFFAQKILIPNLLNKVRQDGKFKDGFKIVIIDPHGEWKEKLEESDVIVKEIKVADLKVPLSTGENAWKSFFAMYNIKFSGNDGASKHNKQQFEGLVRAYKSATTPGLFVKFLKQLSAGIENFKESKTQKKEEDIPQEIVREVKEVLEGDAQKIENLINNIISIDQTCEVVVINISEVFDTATRVGIVGLVVSHLFDFMRAQKASEKDISAVLVIEEAHNFAPEKGYGDVSAGRDNTALTYISKVAAEGRKFGLGMVVITQRPASVNKYVLSQMGTYAVFRLVNKNDLDAIVSAIEFAGTDVLSKLPSLKTGMALLSGLSLPFPVFVDMRR